MVIGGTTQNERRASGNLIKKTVCLLQTRVRYEYKDCLAILRRFHDDTMLCENKTGKAGADGRNNSIKP